MLPDVASPAPPAPAPTPASSAPGTVPGPTVPLGVERAHYVALGAADPAAAAAFADKHMGLSLVHVDDAGRHYLAGHGLDPYSVVYVPGEAATLDHVSFVVRDLAALHASAALLDAAGQEHSGVQPSDLWRHEPHIRFRSPSGHTVELTVGVHLQTTMGSVVSPPSTAPAAIGLDHVVVRVTDVDSELAFAAGALGLLESSRIVIPEVGPALTFFRAHTLYHCLAVARSGSVGVHHYQLTLKDGPAVFAAYEAMRDSGEVEMVWGPVRHGPGHNIAFYIRDQIGNFVEYSAEEELILDNESYRSQVWSVTNQRSMDEWGTQPPDVFFA